VRGSTRILPILLFVLILGLSQLLGCNRDQSENPEAREDSEPVIPVTVTQAPLKDVTLFMTFTGKIRAIQDITICSKVGGILQDTLFDEGDLLAEDQTIALVEDEEYLLAVREAEAALFSAKSNLKKMRQFSRPQEIDAARAGYEQAQADFKLAQLTWERRKRLYDKKIISKQEYDMAEMDFQAKRAARDMAREKLDLVKEGARSEDIQMARFRVKQSEAAFSLAKKRLNDTRIKSPIRGLITRKMVEAGDLVAVGTPIANVVDITRVETEVGVTEKELPYIRGDSQAVASVVAYPHRTFPGWIVFVGLKADGATGTFPVKIEFENPSRVLKPGMVAEVRIEKETHQEVVIIPQDAVVDKVNRKVIFVIENGRSRERSVELGPAVREEVIVRNGLAAGETFAVVGQQSLKNGSRVRIEKRQ
jgi:multidrug efflux pump subunit AcrA (membrane-fusion protein)